MIFDQFKPISIAFLDQIVTFNTPWTKMIATTAAGGQKLGWTDGKGATGNNSLGGKPVALNN
jgi:hypothetical protein